MNKQFLVVHSFAVSTNHTLMYKLVSFEIFDFTDYQYDYDEMCVEKLINNTEFVGGIATVEIGESLSDVDVISPTGVRVSDAQLEDTGLLTFPASRVGRYVVRSAKGPVAEVEAVDATAVKVLSIGDAVVHRPAILTGNYI